MISITSCYRFGRSYLKIFRTRPAEALAFTFVVVVSIILYIHGAFYILPLVMVDQSQFVQTFSVIAATWCITAIWANLYFLHSRDSSIAGKVLEPVIVAGDGAANHGNGSGARVPASDPSYGEKELRERLVTEHTKAIGQQFLATPFGSEVAWHICGMCETYVPPRSWHCAQCNTCILRRDHHCIFTMCCIGLYNQVNFLGLLLYLAIGCFYAMFLNMSYSYHYLEIPVWLYLLKSLVSAYTVLWNFSVVGILSSVSLLGGFAATGVFCYYFFLALQGKTSSDHSRGIVRVPLGQPKYSYQMLESFLGPNPILQILWPFTPRRSENGYRPLHDHEPRSAKVISENLVEVI